MFIKQWYHLINLTREITFHDPINHMVAKSTLELTFVAIELYNMLLYTI